MARALRITYRKSCIGYRARHRATLRSLGLYRLGQSRVVPDHPSVRGMLRQVAHMVEVEPVEVPDGVGSPSPGPVQREEDSQARTGGEAA